MMYAITETSFRSINSAEEVAPGETVANELPQELIYYIDCSKARWLRDSALRASDWTQAVDSPLSAIVKDQWFLYRQQLRDWPASEEFPYGYMPEAPGLPAGTAEV